MTIYQVTLAIQIACGVIAIGMFVKMFLEVKEEEKIKSKKKEQNGNS